MPDDHETRDDSDNTARGADDAPLVLRARAGDPDAFGELYDRWFDRVLDLAYRILWNADAAADTAQDAFVSAWRNIDRLDDPRAFGGWLLRIARNAALDRARREQHTRPADAEQLTMMERNAGPPEDRIGALDDPARVAEDGSYVALLWDSAEALGERDRDVLDLHLRHGLGPAEIGEVVGINRNAANQLVHRVRQRLGTAVGARMLWRRGQPSCAALRAELVDADVERFDGEAVHVIDRHAGACDQCNARRRLTLSPAQMFSAIPIVSMPALKTRTAHALAAEGVPMQGSLAFDGAGVTGESGRRDRGGRGGHGRRAALLAAGGAAILLVVLFVIAARGLDDDEPGTIAVSATTSTTKREAKPTTTRRSTSTTSTSTTTTSSTTTTTVAAVVPPTSPPTAPPTTAAPTTDPPRVTVRFTLEPDEIAQGYPKTTIDGPVLRWTVRNAARVRVFDDVDVFDVDSASGTEVVCPDNGTGATCNAQPGTYVYTLDAFNARNQRVLHRTLTLTIV
jgi:RNA polymerase sigma factor (sigma-70 family)